MPEPRLIEVEARVNLPRIRHNQRVIVDANDETVRGQMRAGNLVKVGTPKPAQRPPEHP